MTDTNSLLREYARNGSEAAFRQLVSRYVDLVYSTALRRVSGDGHAAEDIVQTVFTDLASKAGTLKDVRLGGWLHRHCCFIASNFRRAESRRLAREREAVSMEAANASEDWTDLAPELDEAIERLGREDHDAIILRYFENQDFRAIGRALGATEKAAQKRVTRALEKLRQLLAKRGVTLSAGTLTTLLVSESVSAAPATLGQKVSQGALQHGTTAAATAGATAWSFWPCAAVITATALVLGVALSQKGNEQGVASEVVPVRDSPPLAEAQANVEMAATTLPSMIVAETNESILRLTIVSAESGRVIPNVPITYRAMDGMKRVNRDLFGSRVGICDVPFTANTMDLELITRVEGYADTRLHWDMQRGERIPAAYTLRLTRGKKIGGKVVNSRGELVPGSTIIIHCNPDAAARSEMESHEFDRMTVPAEDGTWETYRILERQLTSLYAEAQHPDYLLSDSVHSNGRMDMINELLAGSHIFHLSEGVIVRGIVVNQRDEPIADAKILVGELTSAGAREGVTGSDGRFEIKGCVPMKTKITASAVGYAAKMLGIDARAEGEENRIVLEPGRQVRVRVVDKQGHPISDADVALLTWDPHERADNTQMPQAQFWRKTDSEGRMQWSDAPAEKLYFDIMAAGYLRLSAVPVAANGAEHTFAMERGLRIYGTVRDEEKGLPIPRFRIIAGYPSPTFHPGEMKPEIRWSRIARHWLPFANGKFDYTWEERIITGTPENFYVFKIEAEGYKPMVTRVIKQTEGEVRFDIKLARDGPKLTIYAPDGRPASETDACVAPRNGMLALTGSSIARGSDQQVRTTDTQGQVSLNFEKSEWIVAASRMGFAIAKGDELGTTPTLRLQRWGHLEGRLTQGGKPLVGEDVFLQSKFGVISNIYTQAALTDSDGHFDLQFAPSGNCGLMRRVYVGSGKIAWTSEFLQDVEINEGQTVRVNAGASPSEP